MGGECGDVGRTKSERRGASKAAGDGQAAGAGRAGSAGPGRPGIIHMLVLFP